MGTTRLLDGRYDTHVLRFRSLFNGGRGLLFPCDSDGRVDMNALSEQALGNYLYARAVMGREFATPSIEPS
jgi:hypothetical protein